jgi:ribosomal protein S18 acetylase RimI-like enzyme
MSPATDTLHLAQFNVARLRHPVGHPASASFVALIDDTNALAESSTGFVWRHGIDTRDVDDLPYDDKLVTVNQSVWESVDHLVQFAYRGFHRDVFRRRAEWMTHSAAVMWWVHAGTVPSLQEGMARLAFHDTFGSSPYSFCTGERFPQLVMRRHAFNDPVVAPLLAQLDAELVAATPEGGTNFLSIAPEHVAGDQGAFFVAWVDGQPLACGAWRRVDEATQRANTGEVKRMWAAPAARGMRLGAAVLATVQADAVAAGVSELRLETGEHLTAAVSLYRRFGFDACEPWGEYVGAQHSYTMSKPIEPIRSRHFDPVD